jgi:hypothetical protein
VHGYPCHPFHAIWRDLVHTPYCEGIGEASDLVLPIIRARIFWKLQRALPSQGMDVQGCPGGNGSEGNTSSMEVWCLKVLEEELDTYSGGIEGLLLIAHHRYRFIRVGHFKFPRYMQPEDDTDHFQDAEVRTFTII